MIFHGAMVYISCPHTHAYIHERTHTQLVGGGTEMLFLVGKDECRLKGDGFICIGEYCNHNHPDQP